VVSSFQVFRPKFCMHFSSLMRDTCLAHLILNYLTVLKTFGEGYKLRSFSLCNFSTTYVYFLFLGSKYSAYHFAFKYPQCYILLSKGQTKCHDFTFPFPVLVKRIWLTSKADEVQNKLHKEKLYAFNSVVNNFDGYKL
jgi:hypothetical protein